MALGADLSITGLLSGWIGLVGPKGDLNSLAEYLSHALSAGLIAYSESGALPGRDNKL
jgi:hypothetical protein